MQLRSLLLGLSVLQICIYGTLAARGRSAHRRARQLEKGECERCSPVKKLDPLEGNTYISKANRCGSTVTFACNGEYQTVYPFSYLECREGKWISEWGMEDKEEEEYPGNPWCAGPADINNIPDDYEYKSDCEEFYERKLCSNGGYCMVEGESSLAMCVCRPGWKGRFCSIPSDNLCPRYCSEDYNQGKCVFVDNGGTDFHFKCECNEGFSGSRCMYSTGPGDYLPF
ncbi:unnamed protein product [Owenia fusiformis]|uniref:Uncharacterized protein n=1 Tax=Owenia fusiformis TaxID=6347 RepID=A0A8J1XZR4_OWEFU|nr:unnamed protein product [Owenia fusiformis]